ncbi:MAG: PH domain-containing protein [Raoultibacter sp.]|jgi:membrane protein YdbS with pleckstrin-like domain
MKQGVAKGGGILARRNLFMLRILQVVIEYQATQGYLLLWERICSKTPQRKKPMRELPKNQLNPKIKNVWRINDAIWTTLTFVCCFAPFMIAYVATGDTWCLVVCGIVAALYLVGLIVLIGVLPPIRYVRWRYELSQDYLDISLGIIWRKRFIIPFIRVQNTDTRQGPILRAFKLSSVTVSTAAGEHEIPGLDIEVAEEVRDKAAELARIAQEDV